MHSDFSLNTFSLNTRITFDYNHAAIREPVSADYLLSSTIDGMTSLIIRREGGLRTKT